MSLKAIFDVPAPAKVNLFLHIVGRRQDGYHLLQSVFMLIDWCDTLHFEWRQDGQISRTDLGPALPADDLSLRAARLLQSASACTAGVHISVDKRVPWGAGMGGGSSDAASTLLALNRLWGLHWPRQRLADLGLKLGADVPFFVHGSHALVQGIGEQITPLTLPPQRLAVVKPPQSIATVDIFAHPALVRNTAVRDLAAILLGSFEGDTAKGQQGSFGLLAGGVQAQTGKDPGLGTSTASGWKNDLQPPAEDRCAQVAQAARWLQARYGNSRMTGSGSAVFARVFDTGAPPLATFPTEELPPGWVGRLCNSLPQHPLVGWAG